MKIRALLRSFQFRVTMALIGAMLFLALLSNSLIHQFALNAQFEQLRDKLMIIARTAALSIDADTLRSVPLTPDGMNTSQYQSILRMLKRIKAENQPLAYIYTMVRTDRDGIWQFVVDADPLVKRKDGITAYPGDKYNVARFPEMMKAFNGASADRKLEVDEWGATLSGYAPILDRDGKAVAVLGVDLSAGDVYATQQVVHKRFGLVMVLGLILSLLLGMIISRRITDPIEELVEGTRRLSRGELGYQVNVRGKDEIGELAAAFNRMAEELWQTQRKNHRYFYGVIQSLVRIVEAKDPYTRGHSERVASVAAKIAAKMDCSQESVETLKQIAVLHDVGKLGIRDEILNKPGKLTEEEWEIVRQHPIIGEEILKPVSISPEMLAIVRGHHERWDGTGYPDGLKGEDAALFVQILTVADAYDAMVSTRAYRAALGREAAVAELKKNRGSQFSPRVVDALLQVLEEEEAV
jgi:HD-GYP domain-containing protein (c-di-GMP phosphodiesterase class II)